MPHKKRKGREDIWTAPALSQRQGDFPQKIALLTYVLQAIKMRSKIFMCQPETVLLIASEAEGLQYTTGKAF